MSFTILLTNFDGFRQKCLKLLTLIVIFAYFSSLQLVTLPVNEAVCEYNLQSGIRSSGTVCICKFIED